MKTLLTVCCAAAFITGCACDPTIKTEVVTVNKPLPFIPAPPAVPKIEYEVDKLAPSDSTLPGKVGQAYVHDMTFLRKRIEIDDMIFEQYRQGSVDLKALEQKIQELYKGVETRSAPVDSK